MINYILRNIDPDLWRKVKIRAAVRGITIRQLIINLLKREVER